MEASSVSTEPAIDNMALKGLLDAFGSRFSLEDVACTFVKADRDPNLAAQILCGMKTGSSSCKMDTFEEMSATRPSLQSSDDSGFRKSQHANGIRPKVSTFEGNPASVRTISSILGKKYEWRVVRSNATFDKVKPLIVDASEFSVPQSPTNQFSFGIDENVKPPRESSLSTDANLHDDIVNFLFEMLGRGFQLERSAIREVLGNCGYDMKKGLETLLDLTAANLDRRNINSEGRGLFSDSKTLSSHTQVPKQNIEERLCRSRCGSNGMQTNGKYELQQDVLTSQAPAWADTAASQQTARSSGRSRATRTVISEPLEDICDEVKTISQRPLLVITKDEDVEGAYQILRKSVKEHREKMRDYYKAAAEAFASGDRARAASLLEKGQYFYNKAREADEESTAKIFETSVGGGEAQDDISLDLQTHDARAAIQLVKCHLRSLSGIPFSNLKIIIGTGDQKDVQKRKRLLKKLLEREAIKWEEDEKLGTLLIRLEEINPKSLSFARK